MLVLIAWIGIAWMPWTVPLASAAWTPQEGDGAIAQELLDKAEAQAAEGKYKQARSTYAKLAKRYPDTPAGAIARDRSAPSAYLGHADLVRHGPSRNRVDVLLMGDGYTLGHMQAFDELAADVPPLFERNRTLREYYRYFNFTRVALVSAEAGVDGFGREYDTALGGYTRDTDAGHVGIDFGRAREHMAHVPEHDDLAIVFVKRGILGTGGGGLAVIGGRDARTTIHEWGHAFGQLQDEYSGRTHDRGLPASGINISTVEDEAEAPWAHWIAARCPGVGLYEGGAGQVRDVWRPTASNCIMNSADAFCPVCREALVLRIYREVDPIEAHRPPTIPVDEGTALILRERESLEFHVQVLRPNKHHLQSSWWILREEEVPRTASKPLSGPGAQRTRRRGDRRDRGPLGLLELKPASFLKGNKKGEHDFVLKPQDLPGPGRYRILCRVQDTTHLRGEKFPWVLKDPQGLLWSERGWWVEYEEAP